MRGDYRHNKTRVLCNYRKHLFMTHYILLFDLVFHYDALHFVPLSRVTL
jgi:hypothetical protein